jgi:hypothetical protein
MTKSGLLGAAMVLSVAFALPALAQDATKHATMKHMAANRQNAACDPRDPGAGAPGAGGAAGIPAPSGRASQSRSIPSARFSSP